MRVLVVDQDSTLLTAITRTLGEYFSIDAVTNKADCLDLVRLNEFDVIVAGERLEDGSGLELLGQLGRTRPDMLRIFAAERERLKLLKGRLGPFGLFRTLTYPIQPQAAPGRALRRGGDRGIRRGIPSPGTRGGGAAPTDLGGPAQIAPAIEPAARRPAPSAKAAPRAPYAPRQDRSRSWHQRPHARRRLSQVVSSAPARTPEPVTVTASSSPARARQTSSPRARGAPVSGQPRQAPRQPTSAALATASKPDIVTRPKVTHCRAKRVPHGAPSSSAPV